MGKTHMIPRSRRAFFGALLALVLTACEPEVECQPGQESCACAPSSRCDDGLACTDGTCVSPEEVSLVIPAAARACEVLLRDAPGGEVTGAGFEAGVTGAHVREAPRTALSFASTPSTPIGAVRVQVLGSEGAFTVERSRCFDASGAPLADGVRVGG